MTYASKGIAGATFFFKHVLYNRDYFMKNSP